MGTPAASLDQLDPETFLALAPVVAAAVSQGAFSPEWLNSVIRLEWLIAADPKGWKRANTEENAVTGSKELLVEGNTLSQWRNGRTEIPHKPFGRKLLSLGNLYEVLNNLPSAQRVTLPWLVGLDRPNHALATRAERVRWVATILYPGADDPDRNLWAKAHAGTRPEGKGPLPDERFTDAVMASIASNVLPPMDPDWLRTGTVTAPAFATPHPTLTIGEIAPDVEVKLNRREIIALLVRQDGTQPLPPALVACDPYQRLSNAHDGAHRTPAAPPARPTETSFLLSWRNTFAVCAKDGRGPAPVGAKTYPEGVRVLVSEDIRDGTVIGSTDGNRLFIVTNSPRR